MYQKLIAVLTVALMVSACGGDENNKATNNNTGTNGPSTTNGPGTNGPGTNGPGTNSDPCGGLDEYGVCVSATERQYCGDDGELETVDCSTVSSGASCIDIDGSAFCGIADGEACIMDLSYHPCATEGSACVTDMLTGASSCRAGFATCDEDTFDDTLAGSCVGDVLLLVCNLGQPIGLDCAAAGGTCDATRSVCVVPEGSFCESDEEDQIYVCADGFTCTDTGGDYETCVAD